MMARRNVRFAFIYVLMAGLSMLVIAACKSTQSGGGRERPRLDSGWRKANSTWQRQTYPVLQVSYPSIPGAEFVHEDRLCSVCHQAHTEAFQGNVHRQKNCEDCHGPASRHLETRGKEPGSILAFDKLTRAQRAEVCAKCHTDDACSPGSNWRTSAHAHHGVDCLQCHVKNHYNVAEGTPAVVVGDTAMLPKIENWKQLVANLQQDVDRASSSAARTLLTSQSSIQADAVTTDEPDARKELPSLRGTSNFLGAVVPDTCYGCHSDMRELEEIAHPHQINGPNGMNCTTCHDTHGNILETSRKQLCLECHQGTSTDSWHSSVHDQVGVACTDCHNPHPRVGVQQQVNIRHTSIQRPPRMPMSVDEPEACYKCHPKIRGLTHLPSHHPILEGKMTCSDCHNAHGNAERNLREETVNMVCYRCHADKQGPFVYEHPPVTEDCSICHEPHGTVANNLLRQPPSFLCLRCHAGHRASPSEHFGIGTSDIDGNPALRSVFYTDCTQCHQQVHGSDHPSQQRPGTFLR
jgi:DmsE family decaheme c-type cytochrome